MNAAAIIALIDAAITLIGKVKPALAALRQSGELTKAQEKALDSRIEKLRDLDHWKV